MFVLCEEAKRIDVVGLSGFRPPRIPGSLQLVPVTRIENFSNKRILMEHGENKKARHSYQGDC